MAFGPVWASHVTSLFLKSKSGGPSKITLAFTENGAEGRRMYLPTMPPINQLDRSCGASCSALRTRATRCATAQVLRGAEAMRFREAVESLYGLNKRSPPFWRIISNG